MPDLRGAGAARQGAGGGPRQRRWLEADLERVVNGVRVQVGEQAQAVAGELLPGASRTQERWLDLVAGATGLLKRVQNHRIDLADALARRAELRGGWTIRQARCAG